ncbi:MAG: right-handed parallel beta-helix repeat-containing protein [Solirubrobacterales bacterium]
MSVTARKALIAATTLVAIALAILPTPAAADAGCDRFASPTGSNANPGTEGAPVRSIARLIEITGPGEDGCLPPGSTFVEPIGTFIVDNAGGQVGDPVKIRTADPAGSPAVVKGAMWLKGGVHDLTFERVRFTDSPGNNDRGTMLVVHGDRITFRYTEMTFRRGICLNAGHRNGYAAGDASGTVIAERLVVERSRIHDCGNSPEIIESLRNPDQSGVHGLYLVNAVDARIRDNYIYDVVSRGLQFWPDVDSAVVEHNVFDGNGSNINVGSSAAYGHFSENNRFEDNIVSGAVLRSEYDPPWGPGDTESIVGNFPVDGSTHGNSFADNCIHQNDPSKVYGGQGYTHSGDVFGEPGYVNAAAADFRLRDGSPCAGKGPRGDGVLDVPIEPVPPVGGSHDTSTGCERGGLRLRFARRPTTRGGDRSIRFTLVSGERVEAAIALSWTGPRGTRRLTRRQVVLRPGANRLSLGVRRASRRASGYTVEAVAVNSAGECVSLGSRAAREGLRSRGARERRRDQGVPNRAPAGSGRDGRGI